MPQGDFLNCRRNHTYAARPRPARLLGASPDGLMLATLNSCLTGGLEKRIKTRFMVEFRRLAFTQPAALRRVGELTLFRGEKK